MKKSLLAALAILPAALFSQAITFTDQSALLPTTYFVSGNAIGISDMNNDGKDDIVRAFYNQQMYIDFQHAPNQQFGEYIYGSAAVGDPWGMCIGDVNNDGFNDVFYGGYGNNFVNLHLNDTTYTPTFPGGPGIFVQGCNFFDINNDGHLDAFVCNDDNAPNIYAGNGSGGWTYSPSWMPLATFPSSDNSGNYASIWSDINADGLLDCMITHCRQGVSASNDPRRIDQVFINNGNNTYTQDITNWTGLRDGAQGWSTAWGDIDNDGDMDAFVLNYDVNSTLMINNGSGVFTNTITTSGIIPTTGMFGENATFQDFNNDGFVDLMLSGSTQLIYQNMGNGSFTNVSGPFQGINSSITAHAVGDLNDDGKLDVYASSCYIYNDPNTSAPDKLWMNNTSNSNHYIKFHLTGMTSNKSGIGAIIKIYGPWGVQVREVRSGEGYGIQNSLTVHFGLGNATQVDSVIIHWPSGTIDEGYAIPADQTENVVEGGIPLSTHTAFDQSPLELNVYPNPVSDVATIRLDHFATIGLNNLNLNIYDAAGKLVYSEEKLQRSIISLNRNLFKTGIYFVEIADKEKVVASEKMIVK
jgi:hypothetical protein